MQKYLEPVTKKHKIRKEKISYKARDNTGAVGHTAQPYIERIRGGSIIRRVIKQFPVLWTASADGATATWCWIMLFPLNYTGTGRGRLQPAAGNYHSANPFPIASAAHHIRADQNQLLLALLFLVKYLLLLPCRCYDYN